MDKRTVGKLLLAYVAHGRSAEALDELVRLVRVERRISNQAIARPLLSLC